MAGLLRHGGIEGVLAAGNQVLQMPHRQRRPSARLQRRSWVRSVHRAFTNLSCLYCVTRTTRCGKPPCARRSGQKRPSVALVVTEINSPHLRGAAASALVAGGDSALLRCTPALPRLRAAWPSAPRGGGHRPGRRCTRLPWLKDLLAYPDAGVRTQILQALCRCGYQAAEAEAPGTVEQIRVEAPSRPGSWQRRPTSARSSR